MFTSASGRAWCGPGQLLPRPLEFGQLGDATSAMRSRSCCSAGRRCVAGSVDVLNPCRVSGQIARATSVNAAAMRLAGGTSTASS
jgi:hypothetical protein